jgi:hypothetical protein
LSRRVDARYRCSKPVQVACFSSLVCLALEAVGVTPTQKGFLLLSRKQKDLMAAIASNFGAKRDMNGLAFGGSVEKTNADKELRSIRLSTDRMVIAFPTASV